MHVLTKTYGHALGVLLLLGVMTPLSTVQAIDGVQTMSDEQLVQRINEIEAERTRLSEEASREISRKLGVTPYFTQIADELDRLKAEVERLYDEQDRRANLRPPPNQEECSNDPSSPYFDPWCDLIRR